ncbi:hypothetical protein FRC07_001311 [Ceratobasidium sp. 392]|nr:hypothetical protein FRC07_001311 [Ceratobasidium sp. 392]
MSNLFSGNQARASSDLKARLEALEARYKRDVAALSQRVYNAEGEIHELRALNASLTDSLEDFRRRIGELEASHNRPAQPQRGNSNPNNITDQPATSPNREPRPMARPASSGPVAYRPHRRSTFGGPPVQQPRHPSSGSGRDGVLPQTNGAPNHQKNATDTPQPARSLSSGTNSVRDGTVSPPVVPMSPDSTRSSNTSEGAALATGGKAVVSIDFGADFTAVIACELSSLQTAYLPNHPVSTVRRSKLGKLAVDFASDFLSCLRSYILQQITREIGAVIDMACTEVWLTVPAPWNTEACNLLREVALRAGLVWGGTGSKGAKNRWKDRLKIMSKAEAAAVYCAHVADLRQLRPSQHFMVCDAGGNTVDAAIYRVLGSLKNLEIGEVCVRTQENCGDSFLGLRFRDLVARLLVRHQTHTDATSLGYFQAEFDETVKLSFAGEEDDCALFPFGCFNAEYPDDRSVGLVNGELNIPGMLLRTEVFDPVINLLLWFINDQIANSGREIDGLLLVGRFAWSEYLFKKIKQQFGPQIRTLIRPPDADTAACRGAAQYGLEHSILMSSYIAPRSYVMRVKLQAEPEDWRMRAGYIIDDAQGNSVCSNRLQYLIQKGAVLKKGQTVKVKFRKFSKSIQDCVFEVQIYTSDYERIMRYTDEGETTELCKWTLDLSNLPSFKEHAKGQKQNGFYTEFELGLRLDSTELRGVLLHNGEERGPALIESLR